MENIDGINEKWITGYVNHYSICNDGKIYSFKKGVKKLMTPVKGKTQRYYSIGLSMKGKTSRFLIHRLLGIHFIENPYNKPNIDHEDGNPLNNSLSNLRWSDQSQNSMNRRKIDKKTTSIYKGVFFRRGKYQAYYKLNNKITIIGYYDDEILAAKAYDETVKTIFKDFSKLNFN
jgi:hypothetical protein